MVVGSKEFLSEDEMWWVMSADNQATPIESYYLQCKRLPSEIRFGELAGPQYRQNLRDALL